MKNTITLYDFIREFKDYGRMENFTENGLEALYNWFIDMENDTGIEMELDVIGICCDFSQYETLSEIIDDYGNIFDETATLDDVRYHTTVIEFDGGYIIQDF